MDKPLHYRMQIENVSDFEYAIARLATALVSGKVKPEEIKRLLMNDEHFMASFDTIRSILD